jgi:chromatin assembly factor 1 subunit B
MKASPIIVNWHAENAPIYSADFQPHGKGRLATGGGDNNVRVRLRLLGEDGTMLMVTVMETRF